MALTPGAICPCCIFLVGSLTCEVNWWSVPILAVKLVDEVQCCLKWAMALQHGLFFRWSHCRCVLGGNKLWLMHGLQAAFWQHIEFGDRPSTTGYEFKSPPHVGKHPSTRHWIFTSRGAARLLLTLHLDPACCEKRISLQGSIKCHISAIMHSTGGKAEVKLPVQITAPH